MTYPLSGVFGGTFDPIHNGHLTIANSLSAHLPLKNIHFIPCKQSPHRAPPIANAEHRLAMIHLAIADHPNWTANDLDFQRPSPSYMVDTLNLLKKQQPQVAWCLILGMDAFESFDRWHQWEKILELSHLIIVNRPNYILPESQWCQTLLAQSQVYSANDLTQHSAGKIFFHTMVPNDASATHIRHQLQLGQPNKPSIPAIVWNYICQHKLYFVK